MVAKTYEALSDAFDYEIRANNYVNIAKENAETFWNYKHNYIVEKLESKDRDINVWEDLKEIEEILIKEDELLWEIPFSVIEKIVNYNYWDISENESELISYLQDNTVNDAPKNVLNFIYKQEQFFDNILKQYKDIENWIIPDIEKEAEYKEHWEIKECEFESREWIIKKWLRTLCNVIVNEAISYDLDSISEISGVSKDDLKLFMTNNEVHQNKELLEKLHRFIYRMKYKYNEYCSRYERIAEWKEYEDSELWIKDLSDIELPKEQKKSIERKVYKIHIEEIEKEQEKEEVKKEKIAKKSKEENEEKGHKSRFKKIKNRFK